MTSESRFPAESELDFPFGQAPDFGVATPVAPGIHWVRLPLQGRPDHVNVWLLEDAAGWTVVDCGLNDARTAGIWEELFAGVLGKRPVRQVVATHAHVDHIGWLGHMVERTGAPLTMTLAEYLTAANRVGEPEERMAEQARVVAHRCGCPPGVAEEMSARRRVVRGAYSGVPLHYRRVMAGDRIAAGGRTWEVHTHGGHSPEMLMLFDPDAHLLIAGDQVLTQITPSINVHPTEPWGDPLELFYRSFPALRALPADTYVLPSHGLPFYGLRARIDQVERHHDARLAKIRGFVTGDTSAYEVALKTFERAMQAPVARQALAETLAHLHYLQNTGQVTATEGADGVVRFSPA
jgi:glyoxylase-like metal-dependent hydrolase (beta-lactamase superfamily II)